MGEKGNDTVTEHNLWNMSESVFLFFVSFFLKEYISVYLIGNESFKD